MRLLASVKKNRRFAVMSVCVMILIMGGVFSVIALANGPSSPPANAEPFPAGLQGKDMVFGPGKEFQLMQPELTERTASQINEIVIANKSIKLPTDTTVIGVLNSGLRVVTGEGVTPEGNFSEDFPIVIIERGQSVIHIGLHSGRVVAGKIIAGEEDAFDFISVALPDQAAAIKALQQKPIQ